MKIRKYKQTIDEWERLTMPNGIVTAISIRWEQFPEQIKRKLVFTDKDGFSRRRHSWPAENIQTRVDDHWIGINFGTNLELLPDKNPDMMQFVQPIIQELRQAIARSDIEPVLIPAPWCPIEGTDIPVFTRFMGRNENIFWFFKQDIYIANSSNRDTRYTTEQIKLLVLEFYDRERRRFEKLKNLYASDETDEPQNHRERIPERVRIEVWRRDDGKCAHCGSREKLEYDHIVPVSKGGSNTARNIELLCEACNRKKSNNIE
jgi:hypothetical protein